MRSSNPTSVYTESTESLNTGLATAHGPGNDIIITSTVGAGAKAAVS